MSEFLPVTDPAEIEAVKNGEIEGDTYRDGEVWAQFDSLMQWRLARSVTMPADG